MNQPERLNKVLARCGLGSRRSVDSLIEQGRIRVNGKVAELGQKVSPSDTISLDDTVLNREKPTRVLIAFNKPKGVTTTKSDPYAKVTVMNFLPPHYQHLNPVGRLDRDSRGLLLFTNDGEITLKLEHPRYEHEKEYAVVATARNTVTVADFHRDMRRLATHIIDPQAQSKPLEVIRSHFDPTKQQAMVTVVMKEGKKRQIRRVFEALGYFVTDLQRTRIQNIRLADLKEGEYREIDSDQLHLS